MASLYDLTPKELFEVPKGDTTTQCNMCHLPAIPIPDRLDIDAGSLYQYAHSDNDEAGVQECTVYCTHYLCMLASPGVVVLGEDHEGIKGILPKEMMKEWRRGCRLKCVFCGLKQASIGCSFPKCRSTFHLPCGLLNGCNFQFFGNYSSFCNVHSKGQKVYDNLTEELLQKERPCGVCLEELPPLREEPVEDRAKHLHSPCCGGWFHRECINFLAKSAGYFFKCPFCNNNTTFSKEMKSFGIFVPEQDASWELEGDQFDELEERYSTCDADTCVCPTGRETDEDYTYWEIILCKACGSQGIHVKCAGLTQNDELSWKCATCVVVLERIPIQLKYKFSHVNMRIPSKKYAGKCENLLSALKIRVNDSNLSFTFQGRSMSLDEKYFIKNTNPFPVCLGDTQASLPLQQSSILGCQPTTYQIPNGHSPTPSSLSLPPTHQPLKMMVKANKLLRDGVAFVPPLKRMIREVTFNSHIKEESPVTGATMLVPKYGFNCFVEDEILSDTDLQAKETVVPGVEQEAFEKMPRRKRKHMSDTPHKRVCKFPKLSGRTKKGSPKTPSGLESRTPVSPSSVSVLYKNKLTQLSLFHFFAKTGTPSGSAG